MRPVDWIVQLGRTTEPGGSIVTPWGYRLAGRVLVCDEALPELAPFAADATAIETSTAECARPGPPTERRRAVGFVHGAVREVEGQWWSNRGTLSCEGTSFSFELSTPGTVRLLSCGRLPASALLLGPGLPLLLLSRAIVCLHASAVACRDGALLFLGESGSGKSTLAARLGAPRLADDIVPCTTGGDQPEALLHFPQLKLAPGPLDLPERLPLRAVLELCPREGRSPAFARLSPLDTARTLLANTVASRLFPAPWLVRHLELTTTWSTKLEGFRFTFAHGEEHLEENLDAVRAWMPERA